MHSKTRLPETISIKDLAQQMEKQGKLRPAPSGGSNTVERRALLAAHSLAVRSPDDSAASIKASQDVDGWMMLRCSEIDCYDRNPRVKTNPRFAEIRASIEARGGLGEALSVTRRPGSDRHMCYMGGNTRLQIVQELWHETKDPRYEWIRVVVRPWVSESDVIAAHLIENELRGDTTFWEKARGVALLKSELESDLGGPLSLRALSEHANKCGLKLHAVTATNYLFAVDQLAPFGPHLTHESAGAIRSRFGHLEKLAEALNLDPYVRMTEFQQLAADAATAINAVREQDDPPRLTAAEVERILSQMNAQFARQANCHISVVEQTLLAAMGSEKQLSSAEIRARLAGDPPAEGPFSVDRMMPDHFDSGSAPRIGDHIALPPQHQSAPKRKRTGRDRTDSGPAETPTFAAALNGFAAPFQISSCVRWDSAQAHGFCMEPLADSEQSISEPERRTRQAAHRLLVSLSGGSDAADADARHIVSLLLQPAYWPLMRTLMDTYHHEFREYDSPERL
ncbi:ParB family protein [Aromatoleum toluvorans]|nr:ParB family protein [Aromatoleum toluvorans]